MVDSGRIMIVIIRSQMFHVKYLESSQRLCRLELAATLQMRKHVQRGDNMAGN